MPDNDPQETQQEQAQPSTEPQPGKAEPFRFGADAPEYLRGKTEAEAIDYVSKLTTEASKLFQAQAANVQPQQEQVNTTPQAQEIDPELVLTDPAAFQRQFAQSMQQLTAQQMANAARPLIANQVQVSRYIAEQRDPDVFKRWGDEVDRIVGQYTQAGGLADVSVYENAAKIVRGNHVDDILAEKLDKIKSANPGTASVTVGDAPGVDAEGNAGLFEKIEASPMGERMKSMFGPAWKQRVIDAAEGDLEGYAEQIVGTKVVFDPANGGTWRTEVSDG